MEFPGAANRCRCFAHIVNLVVKAILRRFDGPQDEPDAGDADAGDEDLVEAIKSVRLEGEDDSDDNTEEPDDDDTDGLMDDHVLMSEHENEELEVAVKPVKKTMTKVSFWPRISY